MLCASFFVREVRVETGSLVVYDDDPADTGLERVGKGAANAGIVVGILVVATLGVVALYRFRCTNVLRGYMMLSSGLLLGLLGGVLALASLERLGLRYTDLVSFGLVAYNAAGLGVIAIYAPAYYGLPRAATQRALVAVAVVMAWQLSHYPPVTSWCLLLGLAAYDTFAVLAPCGPLRWLVALMVECCAESQQIQDTFNLSVPEQILKDTFTGRREIGERGQTVQEIWETILI